MKQKILVLLSLSIFIFVLGLAWLTLGVFIFGSMLLFFSSKKKPTVWFWKKMTISISFIIIFIVAISVRVFLIEIYSIPSESMEDTLQTGDKVLVNKLNYGPRLPYSPFEIPWVNLLFYLNKEARASSDSIWYDYKRLKGYSKIKRNDIAIFNFPQKKVTYFIKRCIGMPGQGNRF